MSRKTATIALAFLLAIASVGALSETWLGEDSHPGFVNLTANDDYFYWLFRSRSSPSTDPLSVWLTGGPGCSSVMALFTENGPYNVNADLNLSSNAYSWNSKSNLLFVDQPIGTGFSKGRVIDYVTNEDEIAEDFYVFLKGFFEKFPEFKGRELYITGESYAGHYIPAIGAYLKQKNDSDVNVIGVAIGNGWVDPLMQYPKYNDFAYENNLIGSVQYYLLKPAFLACQELVKSGVWLVAMEECQLAMTTILGLPVAPRFNVYDIRKKCDHPPLCYDFTNVANFLKRPDVVADLGVQGRDWVDCNMAVHTALLGDWVTDLSPKITYLLESKVNVLVYSGDKDFVCNWRGGEAWTNNLEWHGKQAFNQANYTEFAPNGKSVGQYKEVENFAFLRVYDAGHMVPMDQPEAALYMIDRFITGKFKVNLGDVVEATN